MERKLKDWFSEKELKQLLTEDVKNCVDNCTSPNKNDIFNAFENLTPDSTKVLIIGQDPYPNPKKANGFAFSVNNNEINDSIENIFKAVDEYNPGNNHKSNLNKWAKENKVLLLNSALTYDGSSFNKRKEAWKGFINAVIKKLATINEDKLVVFLWGDKAKDTFFGALKPIKKENKVARKILVCFSNHPSKQSEHLGGNFSILAPAHFEACDNFLGVPIWKNL